MRVGDLDRGGVVAGRVGEVECRLVTVVELAIAIGVPRVGQGAGGIVGIGGARRAELDVERSGAAARGGGRHRVRRLVRWWAGWPEDLGVPEREAVRGGAGQSQYPDVARTAGGEGGRLRARSRVRYVGRLGEVGAIGGSLDQVVRGVRRLPVERHRVDLLGTAEVDLPPLVVRERRAPAGARVSVVGFVRLQPGCLDAQRARRLVESQIAARWRLLLRRPVDLRVPERDAIPGGPGHPEHADVASVSCGEARALDARGVDVDVSGLGEVGAVGGSLDLVVARVGGLPVELHLADLLDASQVDLPPLVVREARAPASSRVAIVGLARLESGRLHAGGRGGLVERQVVAGRRRRRGGGDPVDRAPIEVRVVELPLWADRELDGAGGAGVEGLNVGRVRQAVGPGEHHPDAPTRVVREEESTVVSRRVRAGLGERHSRDRRAPGGTALAVDDLGVVVVRVVRRHHSAAGVKRLAEVEAGRVEGQMGGRPLVAGPAEVVSRGVGRSDKPVDLLPGAFAHVPSPDLVGPRPYRESERVTHAEADDPALVGVGAGSEGIVREPCARVRIYAEDGAVQARRVKGGPRVLAAQRSALGSRRAEGGPGGARRVAARVDGIPGLAPVGEGEACTVASADVELPVGAEGEVADRVARVLLAPVGDQVGLRGRDVAADRQPGEPASDHTAVRGRTGRGWTRIAVNPGRPPAR